MIMSGWNKSLSFSEEEYAFLAGVVQPLDTEERRRRYSRGEFINAHAVTDLTKRYVWDLFYAARSQLRLAGEQETDNKVWLIASNHTDNHIETALRRIVGVEIEKEFL